MADGRIVVDTELDSSGIESGISKLNSIASTGLKVTTAAISAVGTALTGMAGYAIKAGSEFEAAMSNVEAISGASGQTVVTASGEMVDGLTAVTEKAKEMGAATKFSATDSAEALSYMAMAGWDSQEMYEGLAGIMNLAAASGEDLASTSDIVTDALTAFGMAANDSGHFADILAEVSSDANTNVSMLGESFKYVAPLCGTLGYTAEDAAVALGLMANAGIKGSQAGTSLKTALANLSAPTKQQKEQMDALGISLTDSNGEMKSLREVMLTLRDSFSDLDEAEQTAAASTIFGKEAMSGMLSIINASDEDFEALCDNLDNCSGAAEEMAEIMQDNLQGQITILKSGVEGLAIAVYEQLQESLKNLAIEGQGYIQQLTDAFNNAGFEGLVTEFGNVLADLIQKVVEAAPEIVNAAEGLIENFIEAIMDNSDEIAGAGAELVATLAIAIVTVAGDLYSSGIELLTKLLQGFAENAELVGEAAGKAIKNIATALVENIPEIIQAAKDIVQGFCDGLSQEFPGVGALISGFAEGFVDTLGSITQEIVDIVSKIFAALDDADPATLESIGKALGTVAAAFLLFKQAKSVAGIISGILNNFSGVYGVLSNATEGLLLLKGGAGTFMEVLQLEFPTIAGIVSKIGGLFSGAGGLVATIGNAFGSLAGVVGPALAGFGSTIATALTSVVTFLGGPLTIAIVAAIAAIIAIICNWDKVKAFFTETLPNWFNDTVVPFFSELIDSIAEFFKELPGKIGEEISGISDTFLEWGSNIITTIGEVIPQIIEAVVTFFQELPYKIGYAIGTVIGTFISWGLEIQSWIITNVPLIIEAVVKFFQELPGKIWTFLTQAVQNVIAWGLNMTAKAVEVGTNFLQNIITFFMELPGKVKTFLTTTLNNIATWAAEMAVKAVQAGTQFVQNVVNFIKNLPSNVATWLTNTISEAAKFVTNLGKKGIEAAKEFAKNIIDGAKQIPSQMAAIGRNIVEGVWNGIKGAASWFMGKVKDFFTGIVDGVKDVLGIHSPSTVFRDEIGKWLLPGVSIGVKKTEPELNATMQDAADGMVRAFDAADDIDYSYLASKMQRVVKAEVGDITQDITVKANSGGGQVPSIESERWDYGRFGAAILEALVNAGIKVEMDERELGRLIAELA